MLVAVVVEIMEEFRVALAVLVVVDLVLDSILIQLVDQQQIME
jgi:hypothetical protein